MKAKKISDMILIATKDLDMWLYYAGVESIEDFYKQEKDIKDKSYHNYNDVIDHLNYIKKLEALHV
jgi:hypothetical protein